MTVGKLIELMAGKAGVLDGHFGYGTGARFKKWLTFFILKKVKFLNNDSTALKYRILQRSEYHAITFGNFFVNEQSFFAIVLLICNTFNSCEV